MFAEALISLITPVYNRTSLLAETIESIRFQTYKNWELILVDDGSDAITLNLLHSYEKKDGRIKILQRNRLPKGAQTCRNMGLSKASGDFIIFMDSDDLLEKFCFEQRVNVMIKSP